MVGLPNFFIVGAPKCGTTSLYQHLNGHPEIFLTTPKEPYYFVKPKTLLGQGPSRLGIGINDDEDKYLSLYKDVKNEKAIGECSASYLYFYKYTITEIKKVVENPKIIIVLRNPIERAFSSHVHHIRRGDEYQSFNNALAAQTWRKEAHWWFGYQLLDVGLYAEQVKAFQKAFDQVHVVLTDDLKANPDRVVKNIYRFLEVDEHFVTDFEKRYNVNKIPRVRIIHKILSGNIRGCRKALSFLKHTPALKFLDQLREKFMLLNLYSPKLSLSTYNKLISYFEKDILELQELINRDLVLWIKPR
jgi:hypothetical protein